MYQLLAVAAVAVLGFQTVWTKELNAELDESLKDYKPINASDLFDGKEVISRNLTTSETLNTEELYSVYHREKRQSPLNQKPGKQDRKGAGNERGGRKKPTGRRSRKLPQQAIEKLRKRCKHGRCSRRRKKDARKRDEMKKQYSSIFRRRSNNLQNPKRAERQSERYLQQILEVKKRLIHEALGDDADLVLPPDDGLFERDLSWVPFYGLDDDTEDEDGLTRAKRSAVDFTKANLQPLRWNMPISYRISEDIEEDEKVLVRAAILDIETKVPCVRFREGNSPNDPYMLFEPLKPFDKNAGICGFAPMGMRPSENVVTVWFNSTACGNIKGRLIHEILHSLGIQHQHGRLDRDGHIDMQWENIDPADIEVFLPLHDRKYYSTYGLPYAYDSIMHYSAFVGSNSTDKPSMVPKVSSVPASVLGQRDHLSCFDIAALEKLYCCPDNCQDKDDLCAFWANNYECKSVDSWQFMRDNCARSCGYCCPTTCSSPCSDYCERVQEYLLI